jgi:hypothetical protein
MKQKLTLYILGTSNSILQKGYVKYLREHYNVNNLSVGASPFYQYVFNLFQIDEDKFNAENGIIIIDNIVNDDNIFWNSEMQASVENSARKAILFAASRFPTIVIEFLNKRHYKEQKKSFFSALNRDTCSKYGIPFFSFTDELRAKYPNLLIDECYMDATHITPGLAYNLAQSLIEFIDSIDWSRRTSNKDLSDYVSIFNYLPVDNANELVGTSLRQLYVRSITDSDKLAVKGEYFLEAIALDISMTNCILEISTDHGNYYQGLRYAEKEKTQFKIVALNPLDCSGGLEFRIISQWAFHLKFGRDKKKNIQGSPHEDCISSDNNKVQARLVGFIVRHKDRNLETGTKIAPTGVKTMSAERRQSYLKNLVFIHIPKTAGMSLHHEIEKHFGRGVSARFGDEEARARFHKMSSDELRKFSYIAGHISLQEVMGKKIDYPAISVLRDPVERLMSLWQYHRKSTLSAHDDLKFDDLAAFVAYRMRTNQVNMGCWYFSHTRKFEDAVEMIHRRHIYAAPLEYYDDFLKTLSELSGTHLENVRINVTPRHKPRNITDEERQLLQPLINEEQKLFSYVSENYELLKREFIEAMTRNECLTAWGQAAQKQEGDRLKTSELSMAHQIGTGPIDQIKPINREGKTVKIIVHIGPHKTGTTSIQHWLLKNAESEKFYYPDPGKYRPGHAVIAWKTMGIHGEASSIETMISCVNKAKQSGYDKIVFSSEEFSRGIVENTFAALRELKKEGELIIVVTLNDLVNRFRSEVYELIKHNTHFEDITKPDVLHIMQKRPGLNPDFVVRVLNEASPDKTVVCIVNKNNPNLILNCFEKVLNIDSANKNMPFSNQSNSFLSTMILNEYNEMFPNLHWSELRKLADKTGSVVIESVQEAGELTFPGFDVSVNFILNSLWRLQLDHLALLEKQGLIELFR